MQYTKVNFTLSDAEVTTLKEAHNILSAIVACLSNENNEQLVFLSGDADSAVYYLNKTLENYFEFKKDNEEEEEEEEEEEDDNSYYSPTEKEMKSLLTRLLQN